MTYQMFPRGFVALLATVSLFSLLACGRRDTPAGGMWFGNDRLESGSNVVITDSIVGDVFMAGGDLQFSGVTEGDYLGAGGNQQIGGRVYGSLRAAGGEILVSGSVERNATIAGGTIELDRSAVFGRNLYLAGGTVVIEGTVAGSTLISGGTVILNGQVGGDVRVNGGELQVGPNAVIGGNLEYRVPQDNVQIDSAAQIAGGVTALPGTDQRGFWALLKILWMLGFLLVGAVVVMFLPQVVRRAAEVVHEHPGPSGLVGLGWILIIPVIAIIAAITLIGLPLALILAAVYLIFIYVGGVAVAIWLGKRVLGKRVQPGRRGVLLSFLVGGVILIIIKLIPWLGPLVAAIATLVGLGALLLTLRAMREQQREQLIP